MSLSAKEAWSLILDRARQEISEQTFRTWLEPTEALEFDGKTLHIGAPDQFAVDWNDSKHSELLASLAPIVLGHPLQVIFRVHEDRKRRSQMDLFVAPQPAQSKASIRAPEFPIILSTRYTFEHFVVGKSNELAFAAANAVAQAPGRVYNPLFIYGETGLGKTHLMQAVAHEILHHTPTTRVLYTGTEQFTNEYVAAIQSRTTQDFRRRFRETDLLLVDDIHFLKGKEATQEEFFHTFNALYEAGRQIIMTSDRSPGQIPGIEARLVSRFQWGMVADIELPDLEHRIAILQHKSQLDHLEQTIPDLVIRFIAEHIRSSVRELEGSVIKLLAYASLKHKDVTIDLAREALRDKLRLATSLPTDSSHSSLSVQAIQRAVAQEWSVTVEGLKSKTRTKMLTTPRQAAMLLCRELLGLQLVEIGNAFGGRDHSTVIHSIERATTLSHHDTEFQQHLSNLRTKLQIATN
jgi:chromosomal replication initiator protein